MHSYFFCVAGIRGPKFRGLWFVEKNQGGGVSIYTTKEWEVCEYNNTLPTYNETKHWRVK